MRSIVTEGMSPPKVDTQAAVTPLHQTSCCPLPRLAGEERRPYAAAPPGVIGGSGTFPSKPGFGRAAPSVSAM